MNKTTLETAQQLIATKSLATRILTQVRKEYS